MTAAGAPLLAYDRPLLAGTVRIRRAGTAVSIAIAPDTPKRAIYSLGIPGAALVVGVGLLVYYIVDSHTWLWSVPIWIAVFAVGRAMAIAVRRSGDPIVL